MPTGPASNVWDNPIILASNSSVGVEFDPNATTPGLIIDKTVSETPAGSGQQLTKVGQGTLEFTGATDNTYTGLTTVTNGALQLNKPSQTISQATEAAGTGSVTITTTGTLGLSIGETVVVLGVGTAGYDGEFTVTAVSGNTFSYTDPATNLATDTSGGFVSFVAIPAGLTVIGITGAVNPIVAQLEQPGQLTPTAVVTVMNKTGLFDVNDQEASIGELATVDGTAQTGDTGTLILGGLNMTGGILNTDKTGLVVLNGTAQGTSDATTGAGIIESVPANGIGNGTFSLGGNTQTFDITLGAAASDMDITMPITGGALNAGIIKSGNGRLQLTADNTAALTGVSTVIAGELQVDGKLGTVALNGGTVSGGTSTLAGQVGLIEGPGGQAQPIGAISPGDNGTPTATGFLQTNPGAGSETWGSGTTLFLNLNNPNNVHPNPVAGSDYDQLIVNGNLFLGGTGSGGKNGGAVLAGIVGANVNVNDTFTIIQTINGGVISGRFAEPNGEDGSGNGIVFINGVKFIVIYNSNSVVLERQQETTTLSLTSSLKNNTSVYGQSIAFTASMVAESGAVRCRPATRSPSR